MEARKARKVYEGGGGGGEGGEKKKRSSPYSILLITL